MLDSLRKLIPIHIFLYNEFKSIVVSSYLLKPATYLIFIILLNFTPVFFAANCNFMHFRPTFRPDQANHWSWHFQIFVYFFVPFFFANVFSFEAFFIYFRVNAFGFKCQRYYDYTWLIRPEPEPKPELVLELSCSHCGCCPNYIGISPPAIYSSVRPLFSSTQTALQYGKKMNYIFFHILIWVVSCTKKKRIKDA